MQKVGQFIMTGITGYSLTENEKKIISEEDIGGIVLQSCNFEGPGQLAELVNSIQQIRGDYPLFIAVAQEGGRAVEFKTHFSQFPSMHEVAAKNSPKVTFEIYSIMAKELSACGINFSFSPCCDILTNEDNKVVADRAFGNTVEVVEKHISAVIRGLQTHKVLACAKHFPGLGGISKDSHEALPVVKTPLSQLISREFIPFIKASKSRVECIMMAHLLVDEIDSSLPTTLSPKTYELLREVIKFSKLIITDDMSASAMTSRYSIEEAAVSALMAGADILYYKNFEEAQVATAAIKNACKTKKLQNSIMEEKLQRVVTCKKDNFAEYSPIYIPSLGNVLNSQEAQKLISQL